MGLDELVVSINQTKQDNPVETLANVMHVAGLLQTLDGHVLAI